MKVLKPAIFLVISIFFMTFARCGHLKFKDQPLFKVILISWLIVFGIFSVLYLKESLRWNHLVSFIFMIMAVFFMFKKWQQKQYY
ncbi:MAG: DMT family protein [Candidatus Firestonebacteria bacterium]|nr:DMT family protein [Candidatus Firestonebacteria bacterium]